MEMNTLVWIVLLLLILVLLVRVTSLQRQLNELKSDVERLENGSTVSARSDFNYTLSPKETSHTSQPAQSDLDQELLTLIQQGKKIMAIKRLREARGLSLKEAKDYVDSLDR
ncbi:ribosomal protein L7/L12 [Paenibacillus sp. FSL R7-0198]|uniref:ribosomal protein L7/L12 n=2 Tax=Paenibacillus TaxID=44249 RepID=UPI0025A21C22|nr:ribosomal protein L7/L12 [Paenibacillus sp. PK1-4R]WJM05927.1 ribosomal protein L7/L12 [Paenibacillus sp. PK1-4R]WKL02264.1 ribosomal protein L7/L12 [Paenibacillus amylolyticus]